MARVEVLIEREVEVPNALSTFAAAGDSLDEGGKQVDDLIGDLTGILYRPTAKPVPMFTRGLEAESWQLDAIRSFDSTEESDDLPSTTEVIPAQVEEEVVAELKAQPGIRIWPNSPIVFFPVDCPPYQPAVSAEAIQTCLGVHALWNRSATGNEVVVGLLDSGVDGSQYPVTGGYSRAAGPQPGGGTIDSHGSMCAADVLVAAPDAQLYDYPFLVRNGGGAANMLTATLEQRRRDGTPHIVSNSWGFYQIPTQEESPEHEAWDPEHPVHRKVREVVASGATVLFAAGNCGQPCPVGCHESSIGAGRSIHCSNSLPEVITVGAVNSEGERIGYSSQGPGMFEPMKPDVAAYSHFFGNFGPGRPGGTTREPYDSGTSAACPLTAGVVALLISAVPTLTPADVKSALIGGALGDGGWNPEQGHGIVNAEASLEA
jgi:serine protease AprX